MIEIDFETAVRKCREAYEAGTLIAQRGGKYGYRIYFHDSYTGAQCALYCAIGAGLTPEQHAVVDEKELQEAVLDSSRGRGNFHVTPEDHAGRLMMLQKLHDDWLSYPIHASSYRLAFLSYLEKLEAEIAESHRVTHFATEWKA